METVSAARADVPAIGFDMFDVSFQVLNLLFNRALSDVRPPPAKRTFSLRHT